MKVRELIIKLAQVSHGLETFVLIDGQPIDGVTMSDQGSVILKKGQWLDERKAPEPERPRLKPKQAKKIRKRYFGK